MSPHFVIVIEVDNKRAHAAYMKGMADLEMIWPQVVLYAQEKDYAIAKKLDAKEAEKKEYKRKCNERYAVELAAYEDEKKIYEAWRDNNSIFKGSAPKYPRLPMEPLSWDPHFSPLYDYKGKYMAKYESIKKELKHMADLAGASVGPYRMTEGEVSRMIEWEDGSRIDAIKNEISSDAGNSETFPKCIDTEKYSMGE